MTSPLAVRGLDPFTVKAMGLATLYAASTCSLVAWRTNRQASGLGLFALGLSVVSLGGTLAFLHLVVPETPVLLGCVLCMVAGIVITAQGIRQFRGFRMLPAVFIVPLCAAAAIPFFRSAKGQLNLSLCVGAVWAAIAILLADASASMLRRVARRDRAIYWPASLAFGFVAILYAARAIAAFRGAYQSGVFAEIPLEMISTVFTSMALVGCLVGMLLASNVQLRHEAQKLAHFDALTNLPNRRYFLQRLSDTERRAVAEEMRFGVIFLDLDEFKAINDTLGHAAGDETLRGVAAAMSGVLRAGDCIARIGGDEFVVIAEHIAERRDLELLTERLRNAAENHSVAAHHLPRIRISCGTALFPDDGNSAASVMRQADDAMYRDKSLSQQTSAIAAAV